MTTATPTMQTPPTIRVEGKVFGQKRPLFTDFSVPLPPDVQDTTGAGGARLTLRDLIARVVTEEVKAFTERQEARRLVQVLSRADIERGLMKGKIDMGGKDDAQPADLQAAIATALLAFEDGLYYVFVDDAQQTDLDREVYLKPDSRMTFLRLVALAGG